jgi:hypothetical protein
MGCAAVYSHGSSLMFLRNIGGLLLDYMTSHPRWRYSSIIQGLLSIILTQPVPKIYGIIYMNLQVKSWNRAFVTDRKYLVLDTYRCHSSKMTLSRRTMKLHYRSCFSKYRLMMRWREMVINTVCPALNVNKLNYYICKIRADTKMWTFSYT